MFTGIGAYPSFTAGVVVRTDDTEMPGDGGDHSWVGSGGKTEHGPAGKPNSTAGAGSVVTRMGSKVGGAAGPVVSTASCHFHW